MNIINIIRIDQDNADLEAVSILASTASNSGWRRRWWWWASNCLSAVCLMRLARAIRGPSSQPQDERDFLCFAGLRHRHPTTEPTKAQSERTSDPSPPHCSVKSGFDESPWSMTRTASWSDAILTANELLSMEWQSAKAPRAKSINGTTRAVREATERRKNDTLRHHPISISPDVLCQLIITQES